MLSAPLAWARCRWRLLSMARIFGFSTMGATTPPDCEAGPCTDRPSIAGLCTPCGPCRRDRDGTDHAGIAMNTRTVAILLALVATLAATGAWYHAHQSLQATRAQFLAGTLEPMAALLKDDQTLIAELQADPFVEKDTGILESYLIRI